MVGLIQAFQDLVYKGFEKYNKYYSSYRGFVVNREDPEGYGRVKLSVPDVFGTNNYDYWAWPKGCYAGKGYGMQIIPQKGEMVWVEFEYGDPRRPIYTFGHHGKVKSTEEKEKPEEVGSNYDNYWFKTPGGLSVEFDDKEGTIRFTDANGNVFEITGDKINLGQKTAANEPAVKGDKNKEALVAIKDKLDNVCDALMSYTTKQQAASTVSPLTSLNPGLLELQTKIGQIKASLKELDTKFEKTKSLKVTLD